MTITSKTLRANGVELNVREAGSGQPALVFLHYWGGSSGTWAETMQRLSGHYRCIGFDFRGWGETSGGSNDYGLDALAADTLALIEELGLTDYVLVGHSMGGKVAQLVAMHRPRGLTGLVLIAPSPPSPSHIPHDMRTWVRSNLDTREGVAALLPNLAAGELRDEQREAVIRSTIAGAPGAKDSWVNHGMDYDLTGKTAEVSVPIVVVIGGKDGIEPEDVLRDSFDKHYQGISYLTIPGSGHLVPLEAPDELAKAIAGALDSFRAG